MTGVEYGQLLVYGASVGVLLAAPIGPINIEIVRRGIREGFHSGWLMGLGALTADTIWAMVIVLGLARFAENEGNRIVLFLLGAVMMAYIGVNSIRTAVSPEGASMTTATIRRGRGYAIGFMMAAFNPFNIVYWLTIGAGLAADAVNRFGQGGAPVLVLGVTTGIFLWVTTLSLIAQVSRRFVTGKAMQWITGMSGVFLLGYAIWFLVSGVRLLV